jgi:hypothetical protein
VFLNQAINGSVIGYVEKHADELIALLQPFSKTEASQAVPACKGENFGALINEYHAERVATISGLRVRAFELNDNDGYAGTLSRTSSALVESKPLVLLEEVHAKLRDKHEAEARARFALRKAMLAFGMYADSHAAKGTPESLAKAQANRDLCEQMRDALEALSK